MCLPFCHGLKTQVVTHYSIQPNEYSTTQAANFVSLQVLSHQVFCVDNSDAPMYQITLTNPVLYGRVGKVQTFYAKADRTECKNLFCVPHFVSRKRMKMCMKPKKELNSL